MSKEKQIEEMAKVLDECCNRYDEDGNFIGNKCSNCEYFCDTNHLCCSYGEKEATSLYNAGYRKQSEWISVDERLPERPGAYLTYTFRGYTKISHFEEWAIGEEPSFDDYTVTHWMPLPEAPKMKGGEE